MRKIINSVDSSGWRVVWIACLNPCCSLSPGNTCGASGRNMKNLPPKKVIWKSTPWYQRTALEAGSLLKSTHWKFYLSKKSSHFFRQTLFVSQTHFLLGDFSSVPELVFFSPRGSAFWQMQVRVLDGGVSQLPNGKNYSSTARWARICTRCVSTPLGFLNTCVNKSLIIQILIVFQIHVHSLIIFKASLGLFRKIPTILQLGRAWDAVSFSSRALRICLNVIKI